MYIEKFDILRGLDRNFVKEFIDITMKKSHEEGDFLFRQGDNASHFYILIKGYVKLSIGDVGHVVNIVDHPGEAFGWSSLVGRDVYSASAECRVPTKVLRIDAEKLQKVLEKHPESGLIFFKRLARILGNRLLHRYEMLAGVSQAGASPSFGSGQVMESPANG